jgi:hypothetical protein
VVTPSASRFYDSLVDVLLQESNFIGLTSAVAQAHGRLFPDETYKSPRTLQVIALALTDLMPIYTRDGHQLTAPEMTMDAFTTAAMELLVVSRLHFQTALGSMQAASLDEARASLTLRQSPRIATARRAA